MGQKGENKPFRAQKRNLGPKSVLSCDIILHGVRKNIFLGVK
jgi:hypothetical protein